MDEPLTLRGLIALKASFDAKLTAIEADAFLRLGELYPAFRNLTRGGSIVIGYDRTKAGESLGEALRAKVLEHWPDARIYLTEHFADGTAIVLPRFDGFDIGSAEDRILD